MSVSITVMPSSSTIAPALLTPDSPPGCNQTNTPSASSCSVRTGSSIMTATLPSADRVQQGGPEIERTTGSSKSSPCAQDDQLT